MIGLGLILSLLALFFVSLFAVLRIAKLQMTIDELAFELARQTRIAENLTPRVAALQAGVEAMVANRMPNLQPLKFNQTLSVSDSIVKSVLFTEERHGDLRQYVFSAIVENTDEDEHQPEVNALLFDEFGLQVGHGRATSERTLAVGDAITVTGDIVLGFDALPSYFRLQTREAEGITGAVSSQ